MVYDTEASDTHAEGCKHISACQEAKAEYSHAHVSDVPGTVSSGVWWGLVNVYLVVCETK